MGVRDPTDPANSVFAVELENETIATSGRYKRGHHIWGSNPHSLAGVSAIGPDLGIADALSTALFSSGGQGTGWLERFPDYEIVVVTDNHEL